MVCRSSIAGRTTADAEGDVVVLLIGMRINHFWARAPLAAGASAHAADAARSWHEDRSAGCSATGC